MIEWIANRLTYSSIVVMGDILLTNNYIFLLKKEEFLKLRRNIDY